MERDVGRAGLVAAVLPLKPLFRSATATALLLALAFGMPGTRPLTLTPEASPAAQTSASRETSFLTVWDSKADTVVASIDATGLAPFASLERARTALAGGEPLEETPLPWSRYCLFERIVVRG